MSEQTYFKKEVQRRVVTTNSTVCSRNGTGIKEHPELKG